MTDTALIDYTSDMIVHIENMTFKLHELRCFYARLKQKQYYKMKLSRWTCDDIIKIVDILLIPDLVKIVYDYTEDEYDFILSKYNNRLEIYFVSRECIYNFFLPWKIYLADHFNLFAVTCPAICEHVMNTKKIYNSVRCKCAIEHLTYRMCGNNITNIIGDYELLHDKIDDISLMHKIFKCLS